MTIINNIKMMVSSNSRHNICVFLYDLIASVVLIYAKTIQNSR